jgi:hypothetical protein
MALILYATTREMFMSKFFALIITPDLSLSRIWTDSNQVIEMLKLISRLEGCSYNREARWMS